MVVVLVELVPRVQNDGTHVRLLVCRWMGSFLGQRHGLRNVGLPKLHRSNHRWIPTQIHVCLRGPKERGSISRTSWRERKDWLYLRVTCRTLMRANDCSCIWSHSILIDGDYYWQHIENNLPNTDLSSNFIFISSQFFFHSKPLNFIFLL